MITIRLGQSTQKDLNKIRIHLRDELGTDLSDTDVVRYSLRSMRKRIASTSTYEVRRCDDCNRPLSLHEGDDKDYLFCAACEEVKEGA